MIFVYIKKQITKGQETLLRHRRGEINNFILAIYKVKISQKYWYVTGQK